MTFRADNVTKAFTNRMGIIHGGAIFTWLDVVTSLAIYAFDKKEHIASVSVHMDSDFINSAQIGQPLLFKAIVHKYGKNMAFTDCLIYTLDGKLIASTS